jgi:hypothetical protein
MKSFNSWKSDQNLNEINLNKEDFIEICKKYFDYSLRDSLISYKDYICKNLVESVEVSRYSVEVNYRTTTDEALEGFAKITLGYVSAALKKHGYHTKHVFTEKPLRLMVTARNWDDGSNTGLITWNPDHNCFVVSHGFYNKTRKTVSITSSKECSGKSAADLAKELHNIMYDLKNKPDRHQEKLKPVPLKRGPKAYKNN